MYTRLGACIRDFLVRNGYESEKLYVFATTCFSVLSLFSGWVGVYVISVCVYVIFWVGVYVLATIFWGSYNALTPPTYCSKQLFNGEGVWEAVGDAIVAFVEKISMKTKAHFGLGIKSRDLFLTVPTWKRAMVFMHLLRYLLGKPKMKPWDRFDVKDYKANVRAVDRYSKFDLRILQTSPKFNSLPEKYVGCSDPVQLTRIRRRSNNIFTSENETESPSKKRFDFGESSSEEEEITMFDSQIQSD